MAYIRVWRGASVLAESSAPMETSLLFCGEYEQGDEIEFVSDTPEAIVSVDSAVREARLYLPEGFFRYRLPLDGDNPDVYAPGAFGGGKHLMSIRPATVDGYRNMALNPLDQRGDVTVYPHATANVETRNESVFCARNVIDGEHIADGHGVWPYGSWGIGARTDAELTLDFGREVTIDALTLYLRADFPHDAYWEQGTAVFSDGSEITFPLKGVSGAQSISFEPKRVSFIRLERLIKCDDPSAFPALRQLEAWGTGN